MSSAALSYHSSNLGMRPSQRASNDFDNWEVDSLPPDEFETESRSVQRRRPSTSHGSEPKGGRESPQFLTRESSKLSTRPNSAFTNHRSRGSGTGTGGNDLHVEEAFGDLGQPLEDFREHLLGGRRDVRQEDSTPALEEVEEEPGLSGKDVAVEQGREDQQSAHGRRGSSGSHVGKSERSSRASGHTGGPHAVGIMGGIHVSGGARGGNIRTSGAAMELQDLPPEALPWSEPPVYASRVSSTVSVNDPVVAAHKPMTLSQDPSPTSHIMSSVRSVDLKAPSGHRKPPPVEVPMLPLRELAAATLSSVRPASVISRATTPPTAPTLPQTQPSAMAPPPAAAAAAVIEDAVAAAAAAAGPPPVSREDTRTLVQPPTSLPASGRSAHQKAPNHWSALEVPSHPMTDGDFASPGAPPSWGPRLDPPQPSHDSPRLMTSRNESRASMRPSSAISARSMDRKAASARKSVTECHEELLEPLPWSARALADFRASLKKASFLLPDAEQPLTARMDAVFALQPDFWPVLPPGALYCLEAIDPRVDFGYLQHSDFPRTKVRVNTYFGKWGRHLVDFVVSWQPTPRAEAAWQLADGKQPPLPWEQRQVVAHTTQGEYQYANTRMRFRGPKSTQPDAEIVEWSDAHGVDLVDTKAANQTAPRNSDKDRDAHLLDPPRPNTWGELARRPLISNLRNQGGGAYIHHVNYDNLTLRTTCGRRVPAGYFFTLVPNAAPKTPSVPGNASLRSSSVGRSLAGGRHSNGEGASSLRLHPANGPAQALLGAYGESVSSSKWSAYMGTVDSSVAVGAPGAGSRPSSAGPRRPGSASVVGSLLPHLQNSIGPSELGPIKSGLSGICVGAPQREESRLVAPTSPTLVALVSKQRWRTYDVPFNHPIHSTRAQDLGADVAAASGRGVRAFSDSAAVLQIAEQELRLPRAFVPGPIVVRKWDDIPRLYAEHMEAARAMMPVTELDNYGGSKLHVLIYHLQCAATLEYDKLDAKLLLLPQMARLGRKSPEIDAWLQVIVEHAIYLYDKLEISNRSRWRTPLNERPPMRRSVTFAKSSAAAPLTNPNSAAWCFPDPLMGTSFATRSALNVNAQTPPAVPVAALPAAAITMEEWLAINKIMDTCRHAVLHDHWVRLRSVMTGAALPDNASVPSSCANSIMGASSDAGATASGEGDRSRLDPQDPYAHGMVNRELLDYVQLDLQTMSSPDFVPPPPAIVKKPKVRGYRGNGPLPPELAAEMPIVHRPVRCRGADDTPLPPELQSMDLWNVRNKAEQIDTSKGDSDAQDAGALRFSQVSLHRLKDSKGFADSRKAEVRRSMQRAMGITVFDDNDVPEYGSDVADDDAVSIATSFSINTADGRSRRRRHPTGPMKKVQSVVPGIACQTSEVDMPHLQEQHEVEESQSRLLEEAMEARRLLLTSNGGRTREQIIEDALKNAESAIQSLKPRPIGAIPISEPDSPNTYKTGVSVHSVEATWRPWGQGQETYSHTATPLALGGPGSTQEQYKRSAQQFDTRSRGAASVKTFGGGPEPFSLEKLNAEPSVMSEGEAAANDDAPKHNANNFGGSSMGLVGLVDYETAMARRRAIAGAEVAKDRSNYVPKSEVLNLFITYCNLGGHPDLIDMLDRAVEAPVSTVTVSAVAKAVSATSRNVTMGRMDVDSEASRQRIRSTAWLLGVTWRRISNEAYTSFLCRVLGWPSEIASGLHRTRATQLIARGLVRGHDFNAVPKAPPRH